jgi:hypothetical protein
MDTSNSCKRQGALGKEVIGFIYNNTFSSFMTRAKLFTYHFCLLQPLPTYAGLVTGVHFYDS